MGRGTNNYQPKVTVLCANTTGLLSAGNDDKTMALPMTPTVSTMHFPSFGALKAEVHNRASDLHQCPGNGTHTRLVDFKGVRYKINYQDHTVTKVKPSTCWEGFTSALRKFFRSCRAETTCDYLARKLFGDGGGGCNHRHDHDSLSVTGAAPPPENPFDSSGAGPSAGQPQPQPAQSPMLGTGAAAPLTKAQSCPDLGMIPAPPPYAAPPPPPSSAPLRVRASSCPIFVADGEEIPPPPSRPAPPSPPKPRVTRGAGAAGGGVSVSGGAREDHRPPSPPPGDPMPKSLRDLFPSGEHRPSEVPSSTGQPARFRYDGFGMSAREQAGLMLLVDPTKRDLGITPKLIQQHPRILCLPIDYQLGGRHPLLVLHRVCEFGSAKAVTAALGVLGVESLLGLCDFGFCSPLSRLGCRDGLLGTAMETGIDPKWLSRRDAGGYSPFHRALQHGCYENCMYVLTHWPEASNVRTRKGQYCSELLLRSGFTKAQQQSLRGLMGSGAFPPAQRPQRASSPVTGV